MVCDPEILRRIASGEMPKGDVLAVARIAGIAAAKRTPELLPLAHVIGVHGAAVDLTLGTESIEVVATVRTADRTGVEMEALTAVQVGLLSVYDMCKAIDKGMIMGPTYLVEKEGGKSGHFVRSFVE